MINEKVCPLKIGELGQKWGKWAKMASQNEKNIHKKLFKCLQSKLQGLMKNPSLITCVTDPKMSNKPVQMFGTVTTRQHAILSLLNQRILFKISCNTD